MFILGQSFNFQVILKLKINMADLHRFSIKEIVKFQYFPLKVFAGKNENYIKTTIENKSTIINPKV